METLTLQQEMYSFIMDMNKHFERLDLFEKYEEVLELIIRYPRTISEHYEITSRMLKYNIETKFDWDLSKLTSLKVDEWKFDLLYKVLNDNYSKEFLKMELPMLIKNKLFKNVNTSDEYKRICNKLFKKS